MDRTRTVMPGDFALPPELVTAQAASLRALARSLARDEHAADDVVQETWVRALTSPPIERENIGGWLRRVVEGFASKRRRAEARRTERERRYALERPEATSDAHTRAETLRAVVDAVLSLEEPYRETVLLRWFEGLPPRDIAVRQGTTIATVNSRLQRAHARLRESLSRRLDIDGRKLRGALLALFGVEGAHTVTAAASLSFVGIALSTTKLITGAVIAVAVLCAFLYFDRSDDERRALLVSKPDANAPALERTTIDALEGEPSKRVEAVPTSATTGVVVAPSVIADRYSFDVTFVVLDEAGRPRPRMSVWIGPDLERTAHLGETAWDGELHSTWRASEPALDLVFELRGGGLIEGSLRRIALSAGVPERIVIAADCQEKVPATEAFQLVHGRMVGAAEDHSVRFGFGLTVGEPEFGIDAAGNAVITDPWLLNRLESESFEMLRFNDVSMKASFALASDDIFNRIIVDRIGAEIRLPSRGALLAGTVVDENAMPIRDVLVSVFAETGAWSTEVRTDPEGAFEVADIPSGKSRIYVAGGAHLMRCESFENLAAGEKRELRFICPTVQRTAVKLVDLKGSPLAKWRVEARRCDRHKTWIDRVDLDDQGAGLLALPTSEVVRLYAVPPDRTQTPPILLERSFLAEGREAVFVVRDDLRPASYLIEVHGVAANDHGSVVMRLWRVDSNLGRPAALVDVQAILNGDVNKDIFRGEGLLPGDYVIEYGSRGTPWKRLGPFHLAPGAEFRLGPLDLEAPAHVSVSTSMSDRETLFQATTRRQGLRVQSPAITGALPATLLLAAGEYQLSISPGPKSNPRKPFTGDVRVSSDEHTSIDLDSPR